MRPAHNHHFHAGRQRGCEFRALFVGSTRRLEPAHYRHRYVEYNYVRPEPFGHFYRLLPITHLTNDVIRGFQQAAQRISHPTVIVGDEHTGGSQSVHETIGDVDVQFGALSWRGIDNNLALYQFHSLLHTHKT